MLYQIELEVVEPEDAAFQAWLKDNGITYTRTPVTVNGYDVYQFRGTKLDLRNMIDMFFFDTDLYEFIEEVEEDDED